MKTCFDCGSVIAGQVFERYRLVAGTENKLCALCEACSGIDYISIAAKQRLEYLRGEIEAERISYGEIAELQELAEYIDPSDTLLLQWAEPWDDPVSVNDCVEGEVIA